MGILYDMCSLTRWRHCTLAEFAISEHILFQVLSLGEINLNYCAYLYYWLNNLCIWLPAGLRVAQPCRYCFYSVVQKWVFRPHRISCLLRQKCGNTAPKTVKILNFGHKFAPQGSLLPNFYEILRFCTRLQVDFKFLLWLLLRYKQLSYKHFPTVGAFSLKLSIAPSGETTDRIKKS